MDNEMRAGIITRLLLSAGMLGPGVNVTSVRAIIVAMLDAIDVVEAERGA